MKKIYFLFAIAIMGSLMAFAQNTGGSTKTRTDNSSALRTLENPVAWFPFDGNFLDYSGNNYHGTNMNATWTTDSLGNPNKALSFNGSSSGVRLDNGYPLVFLGSLTFSCWVYFNDDSRGILFGSHNTAHAVNFEKYTGYKLRIYWDGGTVNLLTDANVVSANAWYFVTFTRDVDSFHIYVNGQHVETFAGAGSNISPAGPFYIGRDSREGSYVVNGKMDDIRIYGSALSDTEVSALYYETATLPELSSTPVTSISAIFAISGGQITHAGGSPVTKRGVVWDTTAYPTIESNLGSTSNGFGSGEFSSNLAGLDPETIYYLRAYASNATGTAYGDQLSFTTPPVGQVIYVNDTATGGNTGTSWVDAFTSFQSALDTASIGNQIWVATGTYKPSYAYDFENSSRFYHFRMIEGVEIYGGFAGTEDAISQRSDFGMEGTNETILSGDIGNVGDSTDNCYNVFYHPASLNLTGAALLDGFTITLGYAFNGGPSYNGRGAGMCNVNNSPSITNTVFLNNYAELNGGGLHNNESDPTLTNVHFISNSAGNFGGGMYNYISAPSITNTTFSSNFAGTNGGGMSNRVSSSPTLTDVSFLSNECTERGGGLSNVDHSSPTITKVTFHENYAGIDGGGVYNKDHSSPNIVNAEFLSNSSDYGGGLYSYDYSNPIVTNATFSKNNAGVRGGGIYIWDDASATFNNCIIWGNTTTPGINGQQICVDGDNAFMNYCCISDIAEDIYIMEGTFTATDTINANPKFIDPIDDFRIHGNSPCVNTGNNAYNSESYDIRGEARIQDTTIDMGAYEWTSGMEPLTDTVFVKAGATGDNTGTSWTNAFTSFQSALDLAASGDQVWVAVGTYKPSYDYGLDIGDRGKHFRMIEGVEIYGGFAGTEDSISQRTDFGMDGTNETILSGDIPGDNCYHVFFHPDGLNLTNTSKLDGFTITSGFAYGSYPHERGGGMYSHNSAPIITNVIFLENYAVNYGGAMHTKANAPSISHVSFLSNYAGKNGGGMDNNTTNIQTITDVTFLGNFAGESGGGIHNYHSSPTITNVTFLGNMSGNQGGGMVNQTSSSPTITNATFLLNYAGSNGGGMYIFNSSSPTLNNCIIWGNKTTGMDGQQFYLDGDTCTLNYCCYANETNDVTIVNDGTLTASNNNITTNPKFVDPEGDLRICGNSPCVNAGNNDYNTQTYDIRGEVRIQDTTIDMGAYEWTSGLDPATSTVYVRAGATGDNNGTNWRNAFTSFQSALELVAPGEQVWVAAGTYEPSYAYDLTDSSRYYHFRMIEGVAIYGGFAGTETALSQRTDFGLGGVNETILSGDIGIEGDNTDNCYHVFYHPDSLNLTGSAILDGFTITGGYADGIDSHNLGGGMMNDGQCSPTITNVSFKSNAADSGGGMYNSGSDPDLTNVLFLLNTAVQSGGGIYNDLSSPTITNVTFSMNSAGMQGGGIYNLNASPSLFNSIIWGNTASTGMQLYMDGGSTSLNYSCYANGAGDTTAVNSAVFTVTNNNITADPKFVNPAGDLRLFAPSPCLNAGNNDYNSEAYDIRGEARIQDTTIDMGAYEWISGSDPYGIYYVKHDADSSNNGTSWVDAFTSFQSALDISVIGDQVWVAAGTYKPSKDYGVIATPDTTRGYHFRMIEGVAIYGGFAGTEDPLSFDLANRDFVANETILSGDLSGDDIFDAANGGYQEGSGSDNCYHVFYNQYGLNLTGAAKLDGFTVTGGNADGTGDHIYGGGMHNRGSSSPIITNTLFLSNFGKYGGGIYNRGSLTITNVLFKSNSADNGGGMYNSSSSPTITYAVFSSNFASNRGGGMYNFGSPSPTINNATFSMNSADSLGGGMYSSYHASPILHNCIIWDNTANDAGNQFCTSGATTHTLNYCCYANGLNDVVEIGSATFTATNCINSNPLLTDDYNLTWTNFQENDTTKSPCIDSGNPDLDGDGIDWDVSPNQDQDDRDPDGSRMDMGAFYFHQSPRITVYNNPDPDDDDYKFYDFGPVQIPDTSQPHTFHVSNDLNLYKDCHVYFGGDDPDQFDLSDLQDTILRLIPNETRNLAAVFHPNDDGQGDRDAYLTIGWWDQGTEFTDFLKVEGHGDPTGKIKGRVHTQSLNPNTNGVAGVTITIEPLQAPDDIFTDTTDEYGEYSIPNIGIGDFKVTPALVLNGTIHEFEPPFKNVVDLNAGGEVPVDFTDMTFFAVSGKITYSGTECPVEGIMVRMDGNPQYFGITNADGEYEISEGVSAGLHTFAPMDPGTGHTFEPESLEIDVQDIISDVNFEDRFTYNLSGIINAGCDFSLGVAVELLIKNDSICCGDTIITTAFDIPGVEDGSYSIDLMPGTYIIDPLEFNYFGTMVDLDTIWIDLREKDTIVDITYHTSPQIRITRFDSIPNAEIATLNDTLILEQFGKYVVEMEFFEYYYDESGTNLIECPFWDSTAFIHINNGLSDMGQDSIGIDSTHVFYELTAGYPKIVPGGTHPHQKKINLNYGNNWGEADTTIWVYITGIVPRGTAFATTTPEVPLLILRDPPGDESYSTFSETTSFSESIGFSVKNAGSLGGFVKTSMGLDFAFTTGFGIEIYTTVDSKLETTSSFDVSMTQNSITENQLTFSTTSTYKTNPDGFIVGQKNDLYVGGAINLLYGLTDVLTIEDNMVKLDTSLIIVPSGIPTTYIYSEGHIEDFVIPSLELIGDTASIRRWEEIIDLNASLKEQAYANGITESRDYSINGGGGFMDESETLEQKEAHTLEIDLTISSEIASEAGCEVNGVGVTGGVNIKAALTLGASSVTTETNSTTVGFHLEDDDWGDSYAVHVYTDPVYGTPVFSNAAGGTMCPWEPPSSKRQLCAFSQNEYVLNDVNPADQAIFTVQYVNMSESGDMMDYQLRLMATTNPNSLIYTPDALGDEFGMYIDLIPYGEVTSTELRIDRVDDVYDLEGFTLRLTSKCEEVIARALGIVPTLSDHATFEVHWDPPCSPVSISSPANNWVASQVNNNILEVTLKDYEPNNEDLQSITLQYSGSDDFWEEIVTIDKNELQLQPDSLMLNWDLSSIVDGIYKLRAVANCATNPENYSLSRTGKIDRSPPVVVWETAEPSDGVLQIGDTISVCFNENLKASSVTLNNCLIIDLETGDTVARGLQYSNKVATYKVKFPLSPRSAYFIENHDLKAQIFDVTDNYGNPMEDTVSWYFNVDQGPLHWDQDTIIFTGVGPDSVITFNSVLSNRYYEREYILDLPEWLSAQPDTGYFNDEISSVEIEFSSIPLVQGAYIDTIFAKTLGYADEMILIWVNPENWKTQTVNLPAGWSGLSSYIVPDNTDIQTLYGDILDELVIALTENEIFYPAYDINTIGNWEQHSAYKVKTNAEVSLDINGVLEENLTLQLSDGWNLIPVVSSCPVDVETLFTPIIADLEIVKEVAGYGIYWPGLGINNLETLNPGEAYYVRTTDTVSLTFDDCLKSAVITPKYNFQANPAWNPVVKTASNHVIGIEEKAMLDFEPGDYIGVFTQDGTCAGQIIVDAMKQQIALVAFGKDAYAAQQQGFETGEEFVFNLHEARTGDEYDLIPEFDLSQPGGGAMFTENGISVITDFKVSETGMSGGFANDIVIYPNPTTGRFTIQGVDENALIEIFDMRGQGIKSVVGKTEQGNEINLGGRQPGIYIIRILSEGQYVYKKLILD